MYCICRNREDSLRLEIAGQRKLLDTQGCKTCAIVRVAAEARKLPQLFLAATLCSAGTHVVRGGSSSRHDLPILSALIGVRRRQKSERAGKMPLRLASTISAQQPPPLGFFLCQRACDCASHELGRISLRAKSAFVRTVGLDRPPPSGLSAIYDLIIDAGRFLRALCLRMQCPLPPFKDRWGGEETWERQDRSPLVDKSAARAANERLSSDCE